MPQIEPPVIYDEHLEEEKKHSNEISGNSILKYRYTISPRLFLAALGATRWLIDGQRFSSAPLSGLIIHLQLDLKGLRLFKSIVYQFSPFCKARLVRFRSTLGIFDSSSSREEVMADLIALQRMIRTHMLKISQVFFNRGEFVANHDLTIQLW